MSGVREYVAAVLLALVAAGTATGARAAMGVDELPNAAAGDGPVTVFYPTDAAETPVRRGPFTLQLAERAAPRQGNGHLVVLSHGSGGAAWTMTDLARRLVDAGFVVALPEHQGDNWRSHSDAGPAAWKRRPLEVSHAIDTVTQSPRFGSLVRADGVGVWGMSAGGHTALTLAGGEWSPALLRRHCLDHIDDDFPTCAGTVTELTGGWLDGFKKLVARIVINWRLDDERRYGHVDPRVAAVVAEVPFAADFDLATLAAPKRPLGIVQAGRDAWLAPRFHSQPVLDACASCERVADEPTAGHGAFLSPPVPNLAGPYIRLMGDPPGYDREKLVPAVHARIVAFFERHLLRDAPAQPAAAAH